ncbi:serine hydrolase [Luteimonas sp. R10]|uniref:serine hydrolase n=1 Tax=Luteimonas sp. R10 TaxID=3108176 RepID=UPI00308E2323|nr:serine hydrolase [Luteimonas sp. R10]
MSRICKLSTSILLFAALLLPRPSHAEQANLEIFAQKFERQLRQIADETPGVVGISVIDIRTGREYGTNRDLLFPTASSIKLLVEVAFRVGVSEGGIDLDESVVADFGQGRRGYTLREVSHLMIDRSDNDATNILIDRVGIGRINAVASRLGLSSMRLRRGMIRPEDSASGRENLSSPADGARLMVRMLDCDLPMRRDVCERMREIAFGTYPEGPVRQQIPAQVPVIQMPGGLPGVRNSWAAVNLRGRPFALGVMGHFGDTERHTRMIRDVTDVAYGYFLVLSEATDHGVRVGVDVLESAASSEARHP